MVQLIRPRACGMIATCDERTQPGVLARLRSEFSCPTRATNLAMFQGAARRRRESRPRPARPVRHPRLSGALRRADAACRCASKTRCSGSGPGKSFRICLKAAVTTSTETPGGSNATAATEVPAPGRHPARSTVPIASLEFRHVSKDPSHDRCMRHAHSALRFECKAFLTQAIAYFNDAAAVCMIDNTARRGRGHRRHDDPAQRVLDLENRREHGVLPGIVESIEQVTQSLGVHGRRLRIRGTRLLVHPAGPCVTHARAACNGGGVPGDSAAS